MNLAGDVQPHMPVDAAVVGVEIVRVPFKRSSGGAFLVVGAVVHPHCQHVFLGPEAHRICDVDTVGGNSVFIQADRFPIQENVARLAHAFEFEKDFAAGEAGRKREVFAIPREPLVGSQVAAAVRDDLSERVDIVEAVRSADDCPMRIVEIGSFRSGHILADKSPVQIEVDLRARRVGHGEAGGRSCCESKVPSAGNDGQCGCSSGRRKELSA